VEARGYHVGGMNKTNVCYVVEQMLFLCCLHDINDAQDRYKLGKVGDRRNIQAKLMIRTTF